MRQQFALVIVTPLLIVWLAACATVNSPPSHATTQPIGAEKSMASQITPAPAQVDKRSWKRAPEISSPGWINSEKIEWNDLRGKVVVVDFWTFACYNCKNTLPYFKSWHAKYAAQGLTILGVHTPELSYERDVENVRQAAKEYGITYPIAIDGDFANWKRYNVWAWPTWFIVDKEGYVRYSHVGEGDYDGSEKMIQQLLAE